MAQKKNRKDNRFPDSKWDREGYPHFWEGTDAARKSKHLQESQAIPFNTQHQEEYSDMEVLQFHSFDKIGIQGQANLGFESVCEQILI